MRASEAVSFTVGDFDQKDGSLLIRHSKSRTVFLGRTARRALIRYLRARHDVRASDPLWLAYHIEGDETALAVGGLRAIIKRRAKDAGIPAPSLHSFRRAFAINMLRNGCDVVSISRMLGHGSLPVVMRYLKQETSDLAEAHRGGSPGDRLNSGIRT